MPAPRSHSPIQRRRRIHLVGLVCILLGPALAGQASAAIFTVGGAGCSHPDLASAVFAAAISPESDEIRLLAGTTHQGQFVIFSDGLWLRGGFPSCAATTPTGDSTLRGDNSSRALFLRATGTVILERLDITGGSVTGDGGGLFIQGQGSVFLHDVRVFGNTATGSGGNVFVSASPGLNVEFRDASVIAGGDATNGGGLACTGFGTVRFLQDTVVIGNEASEAGGGAHLSNTCRLIHAAGGALGGVISNAAIEAGGGVYIGGGAEMITFLDAGSLAVIQGNAVAFGSGGGVALQGAGSVLNAFFALIADNHANFYGGGVYAGGDSQVAIGRPFAGTDPCPDPVRCSIVRGNTAGSTGGALFAIVNASITVHGTHLEGNSASTGGAVAGVYQSSSITIHSSVIAANDGPHSFYVAGPDATLTLGNVTVARNVNIGDGMIGMGTFAGSVRILSSVFDQEEGPLFGFIAGGNSFQLDCVLARTEAFFDTVPAGAETRLIFATDPQLANPEAGNYQLSATSPAIDVCDTTQWSDGDYDIDGQPRDIDNGLPGGLLGTRDLGADEYSWVFTDGFESGGTARWSVAVP